MKETGMDTWAQRATAQLARMRGFGWSFDRAWASLMDGDPPDWRRDFGIRATGTFDDETAVRRTEAWLRDVFRAAYELEAGSEALRYIELPWRAAA
jgi:hypothetical protein